MAVIFDLALFVCRFCLRYNVWVICEVEVAVDIGSKVLVLSLCTSFLMSTVVGSLCCKMTTAQIVKTSVTNSSLSKRLPSPG